MPCFIIYKNINSDIKESLKRVLQKISFCSETFVTQTSLK